MDDIFIDTHVHLEMSEYKNSFNEITKECIDNKVLLLCNIAYDIDSAKRILNLDFPCSIKTYNFIGMHPHYAQKFTIKDIEEMKNILSKGDFAGIGEIGIDRYWYKDEQNIKKQKELLKIQLEIAEKGRHPVVLHTRNAYKEMIEILNDYDLKSVNFHSFCGNEEELDLIIEKNYYFSINGMITFKNSKLKNFIKNKHLNKMLVETDCPYLSPHPYRGKRNRPLYVIKVYEFIADMLNISMKDLKKTFLNNFYQFING